MDKEKQIEDVTAIIDSFTIRTPANAQAVAKLMIEKYNYRKITENEVVISKEEYERLSIFTLTTARQNPCGIALISTESIEEVAKHFGVEIGEKEMTYEELKAEAKRQGYNLIKIQKYIPLTPCVCGAKRSVKLYYTMFGNVCMCHKCGRKTEELKTVRKARIAWNELMKWEAQNGRRQEKQIND